MGHAIMESEGGELPYFIDTGIPAAAYRLLVALAIRAAAIAGVLPALQPTGRRMQTTLKEFGSSSGTALGATWTTLIVVQVALAVVGLPIAIVAFWGEISAAQTRPAFDGRPISGAPFALDRGAADRASIPKPIARDLAERTAQLRADLIARVEAEPAVEDVTMARAMPGDEPAHKSRSQVRCHRDRPCSLTRSQRRCFRLLRHAGRRCSPAAD